MLMAEMTLAYREIFNVNCGIEYVAERQGPGTLSQSHTRIFALQT